MAMPTGKQKVEVLNFIVVGGGPFPIDMLRYDSCWPLTQADANVLTWASSERRHISMQTVSPGGPTEARWESFGWKVEL